MSFVIALDGPAASGKGTLAVRLGALCSFPVLDSGLLYRAVGVAAQAAGQDLDDAEALAKIASALTPAELEQPEVRTRAAGEAASRVAVHPQVRAALRDYQQAFAAQEPGAVIDGRDIGTVIAPHADVKIFVTANASTRADRRWRQLTAQGETVGYDEILDDIERRDARDGGRSDSPLRRADDAVLLDTTEMTIDAAFDAARRIVEAARARQG